MSLAHLVSLVPDLPQPQSTNAGVIAAIAGVITALGGFVLAIGVLVPILRNTRAALINTASANVKADAVVEQVGQVHTIVNQQRTDAQRYQVALIRALREAHVAVPIDQAVDQLGSIALLDPHSLLPADTPAVTLMDDDDPATPE